MVRIFVGAGRGAGLRPADLVGAIANEANVSSREIGAIEIEDRFSLVEVSDAIAEDAVRALRSTSLRGQRVTVRRDQPKPAAEPASKGKLTYKGKPPSKAAGEFKGKPAYATKDKGATKGAGAYVPKSKAAGKPAPFKGKAKPSR
jgi:hypothetical protein